MLIFTQFILYFTGLCFKSEFENLLKNIKADRKKNKNARI